MSSIISEIGNPLVVLSCPREGSSVITNIVGSHGLYLGNVEGENGHGYLTFEHIEIQRYLKTNWVHRAGEAVEAGDTSGLRDVVHRHMAQAGGRRMVVKAFAEFYPVWRDAFPDAAWILAHRHDADAALQSAWEKRRVMSGTRREGKQIVLARYQIINEVAAEHRLPIVNTTEVVREGKYDTLSAAMARAGVTFKPEIADRIIDRSRWTH